MRDEHVKRVKMSVYHPSIDEPWLLEQLFGYILTIRTGIDLQLVSEIFQSSRRSMTSESRL